MTDAPPDLNLLLSRLRFRDLQLIVALGRGESLRSAAARFSVTQPALSRTLAEAEAAFGFALFVRGARGLSPTAQGALVIRGAVALLEDMQHLQAEAAQAAQASAIIRLGAPAFIAQEYLPPRVAALATQAQRLRVQISEMGAPALVQALLEGKLDALVSTMSASGGPAALPADLVQEPMFVASLVVVGPTAHPFTRRRRVSWSDLANEPWIFPFPGTALSQALEQRFLRAGAARPVPCCETASPITALRMVQQGAGFALVPELTLRSLGKEAGVRIVHADPAVPGEEVGLITRRGAANPRAELLRQALLRKA